MLNQASALRGIGASESNVFQIGVFNSAHLLFAQEKIDVFVSRGLLRNRHPIGIKRIVEPV